jgi:ABC-type uncharacterized transport system involved in gliding motility auxiliary subunit
MINQKSSKLFLISSAVGFVFTFFPYLIGIWFPFMWGVLVLTIISTGFWIYLEYELIKNFFLNKHVHKGSFQLITILWAVIVVIALNFLASKYNRSIDITAEQTNTLSKESLKVLELLQDKVSFKVFYTESADPNLRLSLKKLFYLYEKDSDKVDSKFMNAKWEPTAAKYLTKEDQVSMAVFVEGPKGKERVADPISEETLTTAIVRLNSNEKNIIYFTSGHGERSLADSEPTGLSELKNALNARGLLTAPLSLLSLKTGEMPEDLYALVIAGPVKAFNLAELNILRGFLEDGGKLLLAIDPEFSDLFNPLFKDIGLTFNSHYVLSVDSPLPLMSLGVGFSPISEITADFKNAQVMFPVSGSISLDANKAPKSLTFEPLISTSPYATMAKDSQQVQSVLQKINDKASINLQSFDLAVVVEGKPESTEDKLHSGHNHGQQFKTGESFSFIGFADSDFFSNEYINNVFNKDLILNSIVFLTGQKNLITIRPNVAKATTIEISSIGLNIGALMSFFPFLILAGFSIFFWFRKRSQ